MSMTANTIVCSCLRLRSEWVEHRIARSTLFLVLSLVGVHKENQTYEHGRVARLDSATRAGTSQHGSRCVCAISRLGVRPRHAASTTQGAGASEAAVQDVRACMGNASWRKLQQWSPSLPASLHPRSLRMERSQVTGRHNNYKKPMSRRTSPCSLRYVGASSNGWIGCLGDAGGPGGWCKKTRRGPACMIRGRRGILLCIQPLCLEPYSLPPLSHGFL